MASAKFGANYKYQILCKSVHYLRVRIVRWRMGWNKLPDLHSLSRLFFPPYPAPTQELTTNTYHILVSLFPCYTARACRGRHSEGRYVMYNTWMNINQWTQCAPICSAGVQCVTFPTPLHPPTTSARCTQENYHGMGFPISTTNAKF